MSHTSNCTRTPQRRNVPHKTSHMRTTPRIQLAKQTNEQTPDRPTVSLIILSWHSTHFSHPKICEPTDERQDKWKRPHCHVKDTWPAIYHHRNATRLGAPQQIERGGRGKNADLHGACLTTPHRAPRTPDGEWKERSRKATCNWHAIKYARYLVNTLSLRSIGR